MYRINTTFVPVRVDRLRHFDDFQNLDELAERNADFLAEAAPDVDVVYPDNNRRVTGALRVGAYSQTGEERAIYFDPRNFFGVVPVNSLKSLMKCARS